MMGGDQRWTRPEALPLARFSTSATDIRLKSCSTLCFRQEAATAKLMALWSSWPESKA